MNNSTFSILPKDIQTLLHILQCKDDVTEIPPWAWEAVAAASVKHNIAPLLYLTVRKADGVPPSIFRRLEGYYQNSLKRNILHLHRLGHWLKALRADSVPVVVLKGCHLAEAVYQNAGGRVFCDADLLVKPEDMDRAHRCLTKAGAFSPVSDFEVDLHWYLDDILNPDMERIWLRIQPATIGGISSHVLSAEDLLIHLCLHMGFHHNYEFGGLRTLCDIREIILRHGDSLDWGYIADAAAADAYPKAIYLPLYLAKTLVSAKVPEKALTSLCPGPVPSEPVQWAVSQMFYPKSFREPPALSPYFWSLWASGSFGKKMLSFRKLLYPDRNFIAQKYPTPPRSLKTYFYYMVRMKRRILPYLSASARIITNGSEMKQVLESKQSNLRMRAWMTDESKKKG